ncbi:uncharacterized protein LOC142179847 [Nicotiana tabacum]|uniref:Uncharacterized protein LOC142179847 n=1 Tax=Nicotiana tabacum TaxID=4097 RepID=A0AC58UBG6_TOBAC
MRVFGCLGYVIEIRKCGKFAPKAVPVVFLGYSMTQKGYKMYGIHSKTFTISRDVVFKEDVFPFKFAHTTSSIFPILDLTFVLLSSPENNSSSQCSQLYPSHFTPSTLSSSSLGGEFPLHTTTGETATSTGETLSAGDHDISVSLPTEPSLPLSSPLPSPKAPLTRRSGRDSRPPIWMKDYITHNRGKAHCCYPISTCVSYDNVSSSFGIALAAYSAIIEPKTFAEAVKDPKWVAAMKDEISALEDNNTWSIVALPPGKMPIGCKSIFKVKYTSSGEVERYKARLVAKGYSQQEGLDYTETFSLVAKMVNVRSIMAIAPTKQWFIYQMDVHNAFLHGDLLEEVYMEVPPGFAS